MIDLYTEIEEADTSEFTSAKKVKLEKPLVIDGDKIEKLFIANSVGGLGGNGIGAFRETEPEDEYTTRLITEAKGEEEIKYRLVKLAENLELELEVKEK
jgi:hypothetical protein